MEISNATEFWFMPEMSERGIIFISKDLQKLIDMNGGDLFNIYAVVSTASGETLCQIDTNSMGEPCVTSRFIHTDFIKKCYWFEESNILKI